MIIVAAIFTRDGHKFVIQKLRGDKVYFFRAGQHKRLRCLTRKQFLQRYRLAH